MLSLASRLRQAGYRITFLDCLDRQHPDLSDCLPSYRCRHRFFSTGHFPKEILPKPSVLRDVPRKYGRYGLPLDCVKKLLLKTQTPDIICITSGMTYWYPGVFDMVRLCHETFSGVPVILGGIYATLCSDHAKKFSGADYVLPGASIPAALELAEKITGHPAADPEKDFCWPAYDLYTRLSSAAVRTTFGCPFQCPFCASHLLSSGFLQRDPEDVSDEIRHLVHHLHVQDIAFYDDALLLNREKHLIPILKRCVKGERPFRFHTPNGLHPKWVDPEISLLMFQSGFKTLRLSFESVQPERQLAMGAKVSNRDLCNAVENLKSAGFTSREIGSYVLMGLPDQSIEEVIESLLFVLNLKIRVSLASFSPIPGTVSWKEAVTLGLIDPEADPLLTNNSIFPMVRDPEQKAQLTRLSTLTAQANQMLIRGHSPVTDGEWRRRLETLRPGK